MTPSACRSCGAPIVWGFTKNSKRMPVDAAPVVGGNIVLTSGNDGPSIMVLGQQEAERRAGESEALYTSHFKTCPQAATHRR